MDIITKRNNLINIINEIRIYINILLSNGNYSFIASTLNIILNQLNIIIPPSTSFRTNTPTSTPFRTNTPTSTPIRTNTPTSTPFRTNTPTSTPIRTNTPSPTVRIFNGTFKNKQASMGVLNGSNIMSGDDCSTFCTNRSGCDMFVRVINANVDMSGNSNACKIYTLDKASPNIVTGMIYNNTNYKAGYYYNEDINSNIITRTSSLVDCATSTINTPNSILFTYNNVDGICTITPANTSKGSAASNNYEIGLNNSTSSRINLTSTSTLSTSTPNRISTNTPSGTNDGTSTILEHIVARIPLTTTPLITIKNSVLTLLNTPYDPNALFNPDRVRILQPYPNDQIVIIVDLINNTPSNVTNRINQLSRLISSWSLYPRSVTLAALPTFINFRTPTYVPTYAPNNTSTPTMTPAPPATVRIFNGTFKNKQASMGALNGTNIMSGNDCSNFCTNRAGCDMFVRVINGNVDMSGNSNACKIYTLDKTIPNIVTGMIYNNTNYKAGYYYNEDINSNIITRTPTLTDCATIATNTPNSILFTYNNTDGVCTITPANTSKGSAASNNYEIGLNNLTSRRINITA